MKRWVLHCSSLTSLLEIPSQRHRRRKKGFGMKDHAFIVTGVLALALVATGLVWIWIQIVQWAIDHPLWSLAIIAFLAVLTWLPDMRVKRKLN